MTDDELVQELRKAAREFLMTGGTDETTLNRRIAEIKQQYEKEFTHGSTLSMVREGDGSRG